MDGRRDVPQRPLRIRGLALFILTISLVDAMPANPGSLKQNIMSGDLVSDSGSLGTSGNVMSAMGNPLQSSGQDPKLTPVRGTKDEQCSDKETLIMKLTHDLKEAECTLQAQVNELQRALASSGGAQRQVDRYAEQQLNLLTQALNCDRAAICHAQEVASAKACHVRQQPTGKVQRASIQRDADVQQLTHGAAGGVSVVGCADARGGGGGGGGSAYTSGVLENSKLVVGGGVMCHG